MCSSLASSRSKTPFGFVDLKEGQGGCGRNHPALQWKAVSPGAVDFYSDIGAGFQAFVSGVGDAAVNKNSSIHPHVYVEDKVSGICAGRRAGLVKRIAGPRMLFAELSVAVTSLVCPHRSLRSGQDLFNTCLKCLGRRNYLKLFSERIFF